MDYGLWNDDQFISAIS